MTRKEELELRAAQWLHHHGDQRLTRPLAALLEQVEREVWEKVIAGCLRYKESLVPKPGCEKFPTVLLMSFEEWCKAQQQELA